MQTEELQLQINQAKSEKNELLSQLRDYDSGCSKEYLSKRAALYAQIIAKNHLIFSLNEQLASLKPGRKTTPLEICGIIGFILALVALICSK